MSIKTQSFTVLVSGAIVMVPELMAQAPPATPPSTPAVPGGWVSPAVLNKLFDEADAAFKAKDYATSVAKIQELIKALGPVKDPAIEMLYFNIGLGNLFGGKNPEAETAFLDCIARYPKGEYTSRCHLGVGRSRMLQDTPEKKQQAIEALKIASADPRYRSEAGLWLGQVYTELKKPDEALVVFRSLMGSDVTTPQQTSAAVEVIGLLAETGRLDDLTVYLDRLIRQSGVRDALAWYANQVIVRGDQLLESGAYEAALTIYRSVPTRKQILDTQSAALESMRKIRKILDSRVEAEKNKSINQRSNASDLLNNLVPAIEQAETALKAIEEKADLDAALLMRRGSCLYYLKRNEEALVCFRTLRTKYGSTPEAEKASYAEIVIYNALKDVAEIKEKCDLYLQKYPNATNVEEVATLAGEVLVQSGDWKEICAFYRGLETKFPKSTSLDRFVFFQGVAYFQQASFTESTPLFVRFLKEFPESSLIENALYYMAMSSFLSNDYKGTLASCKTYLARFPDGTYAGDMHYRLAFIDFNDKGTSKDPGKIAAYEKKMCEKIVRELGEFLASHPKDPAAGSMLCLIADANRKIDKIDDAIEAYKKAAETESPDDVIQYALNECTTLLQGKKDWEGISELHRGFLTRMPDSQLALVSATWVAKMMARAGKAADAAEFLSTILKRRIGDPASEQVEFLIDEIVKSMVPRKKPAEIDGDALDNQLQETIKKAIVEENPTTTARLYYARARLAQMLKRPDRSDLYLKGIATTNAKDPSVLSPALLSSSGDILLKTGDLEGAEAMYRRLTDKYKDSMFSDAGPVGLGYVALARKEPENALKIFDGALESNAGTSRFKECTLGKLQALVELEKFEPAQALALQIAGDKTFKGETTAKAYLLLGRSFRMQAAKSASISPAVSKDLLGRAHGYFQRVYVTSLGFPDVCAEAYWQAYETAKELGDEKLAKETLKALATQPKLKNTKLAAKAAEMTK